MSGVKELSVVLPCYQEEENLRIVLPRIIKALKEIVQAYEIVVVDTHLPLDETKAVCAELVQDHVRYVNREPGDCYADAVRTGIQKAEGQRILFMDADGSHSPEFISHLFERRDEADIIVASRYVDGGYTENSKSLVYMSKIVNIVYSIALGINCKDVSGSFKLYKAEQLKSLSLTCQNFDVIEEVLYKLVKVQSATVKEVPYTFKQRLFGDSKRSLILFMWTYFSTLIKLWVNDKFSK